MSIRNGGKIIAGYGGTTSGGNGDSLNNQNPTSPIRQVYDWIGTLEEYENQQVAELHPTWVCFILDDTTPKDKNLYTNRNVGDIFFTTRLDLLLNGAVECDGNTYSFEDFTGEQSIGNLLKDGKIPYVSLSQYASLLTNNGVVGVFGWDGDNNVEFRVPTIKDVFLEAGEASEIGDYIDAGLPNITGSIAIWDDDTPNVPKNNTGCFTLGVSTSHSIPASGVGNQTVPSTFGIDASKSNAIYGNSDTVHPKSIKYRPMVQLSIGFTDEAVEKCMNVVNDVAELKEQQPHNLTDSMITNCITHIPQDIKMEINSNKELVVKAGTKFYIPNGINNFDIVIIEQDTVVFNGTNTGDLFVSYQPNPPTEQVRFTLTSTNKTSSGSSDDKAGEAYHLWYDTTNNIIKKYQADGTTANNNSFPLCIINSTNGLVNSIKQVFNGFGFIGRVVYVLPGVKGLMPYGRNEDSSLKNKEITFKSVVTRNDFAVDSSAIFTTNQYGDFIGIHWNNNLSFNYIYDEENNYYYTTDSVSDHLRLKLGTVVSDGTRIISLKPHYTFHTVDYNEFNEHRVIDFMEPTVSNNYTWYRKYSDGWVEQGCNAGQTGTITLPVVMADSNYFISTRVYNGTNNVGWGEYGSNIARTTTTFRVGSLPSIWEVKGIAA